MATKQQNAAKNAKNDTLARIKRTEAYAESVRVLFARCVNEMLALHKTLPKLGEGEMYSFDGDSIRVQRKVEELLRRLASAATLAVENGVKVEWEQANAASDALLQSCFGKKAMKDVHFSAWRKRNEGAMKAFQKRVDDGGFKLSDKIWKTTRQLREEMEIAMTLGIGEGESAADMSRKVRKYLNDPDLMFRRFRYKAGEKEVTDYDEDGNPIGTHTEVIYGRKWKKKVKGADGKTRWIDYDKDSYKVGTGNYKSSARNAMRVTRTETNMAYRESDQTRWQQMDFVMGVHIELSRSHPKKDICDKLAGDYPKDFKFEGWHPQCFCVMTPILMPEDEMLKMSQAMMKGETYVPKGKRVTSYPKGFKDWVTAHHDDIAEAHKKGTDPYFVRHNFAEVEKVWNPKKEKSPLEIAEERHAARTEEQVAEIKKAWEERQRRHALIKKTSNNVLKVAGDYGEVDVSELQNAINAGDLSKMQAASKALAQAVSATKKQEAALSDLIPNAHSLHKVYSMRDLQTAHAELDGVMKKWLNKYGYASLDDAPLDHLKNKLTFEVQNPTIGYSKKGIVDDAITEKIKLIDKKIEWNSLVDKAGILKSFKTKNTTFKAHLLKVDSAIQSKDFNALQKSINDAEKQRQKILDRQLKRSGGIGGALNKEFKGGAVGKDISSGIDTSKMTSEDPYGGTYTNNVARLQGFDSPAKLVTETDFESLASACGDVFYRTLNPAKFNGKDMSGAEFASQIYLADKLELNGPGGRYYGDGIYVATSAWNGSNLRSTISQPDRDMARCESAIYGHRGVCKTLEMTWLRTPRIIKQSDLWNMWRQLSPEQKWKFGNHENTYACALGYDAMYCEGPCYMVIWNRSIIAVKKD